MGYESRVYIISKRKDSDFGEVIAMIDLCKMAENDFYDLFTNPIDFTAFLDNGNTEKPIEEDRCGDLCSYAYLQDVLDWLEPYYKEQKEIYGGKYRMYRRLRPFYKLLKSFDNPQWINSSNDILILQYLIKSIISFIIHQTNIFKSSQIINTFKNISIFI